jgi:pyruvate carboxylase
MRVIRSEAELPNALATARREALAAFGNFEKLVQSDCHVEVQVLGDRHGNVVHLFERDCTVQRRSQKVVERRLRITSTTLIARLCETAPSS